MVLNSLQEQVEIEALFIPEKKIPLFIFILIIFIFLILT